MDCISAIAGLLSWCGISSTRMFAPTFLFGAICRFLPGYDWCPSGIVEISSSCPSFLTSDFGLCVFGVLGVLEVVANWDDSIRELISELNFETYVKPLFSTLVCFSVCTPEQLQVLAAAVDGVPEVVVSGTNVVAAAAATGMQLAAPAAAEVGATGSSSMAVAASLFCGVVTFVFCKVRAAIVATVREFDPDNALHLNTLLTWFEEGSWLVILPLVLVFPLAALLLMGVFAGLGWCLSRPLKKLAARRLAYWNAMGWEGMLKTVQNRAMVIFAMGVVLSAVPVFGYLVTVVALNLLVFGVISQYERRSSRIVARMLTRFLKLTIFLLACIFASIPFMGVVLLLPYVIAYCLRMRKLKALRSEPVGGAGIAMPMAGAVAVEPTGGMCAPTGGLPAL